MESGDKCGGGALDCGVDGEGVGLSCKRVSRGVGSAFGWGTGGGATKIGGRSGDKVLGWGAGTLGCDAGDGIGDISSGICDGRCTGSALGAGGTNGVDITKVGGTGRGVCRRGGRGNSALG